MLRPAAIVAVTLVVTQPFFTSWASENVPPPSNEKPAAIRKLIRQLAAEQFATRERAARELSRRGVEAYPQIKKAMLEEEDPEVRARLSELREEMALDAETCSRELNRIAKRKALEKDFYQAARFYAKAARLSSTKAQKEADSTRRKTLQAQAEWAQERSRRATAFADYAKNEKPPFALENMKRSKMFYDRGTKCVTRCIVPVNMNVIVDRKHAVAEDEEW